MIALQEITKWDEVKDYKVPNHTYILNEKGELVAYIKAGSKEYYEFKKPMAGFTKSRRKFKEVTINNGGPF